MRLLLGGEKNCSQLAGGEQPSASARCIRVRAWMASFKLDSIEEDISSPTTQKRLLERAQALF
jgi:hypothetical protein